MTTAAAPAANTAPLQARPLRLSTQQPDFEAQFAQRLHWSAEADAAIEQRVQGIVADQCWRWANWASKSGCCVLRRLSLIHI